MSAMHWAQEIGKRLWKVAVESLSHPTQVAIILRYFQHSGESDCVRYFKAAVSWLETCTQNTVGD